MRMNQIGRRCATAVAPKRTLGRRQRSALQQIVPFPHETSSIVILGQKEKFQWRTIIASSTISSSSSSNSHHPTNPQLQHQHQEWYGWNRLRRRGSHIVGTVGGALVAVGGGLLLAKSLSTSPENGSVFGWMSVSANMTASEQEEAMATQPLNKDTSQSNAQRNSHNKDGDKKTKDGDDDDDEEKEEDPYDNLPDEDEPTDCSMCNTFRQGPCRPYWRKLERCFKDNEGVEDGAAANCLKYFTPHQNCLLQYMNLYLLVGHEMKQEMISDIESAFSKTNERRTMAMPFIDWSLWLTFLQEQGLSFRQTTPSLPKETPLWKRMADETAEPVLINLTTKLPNDDESTGWILKVAYVLNQDGKVLGFVFNEAYSKLLQESKTNHDNGEHGNKKNKNGNFVEANVDNTSSRTASASESSSSSTGESRTPLPIQQDDDQNNDDDNNNNMVGIDFVIMPGETQSIQVKAFYSENPVTAPPDKVILDACLCESPLVTVPIAMAGSKEDAAPSHQ